ncbi:site-specific integrase [Comamonas jiangduensis]|uniref:site-specific integrase n=1 Tax=Comamonas jiangduensis TaxID=1194168 RepID=UPI003BF888CA
MPNPIIKENKKSLIYDEIPDFSYTRGGTKFYPRDSLWVWREDVFSIKLDFDTLELPARYLTSLKITLCTVAQSSSTMYVRNLFHTFKHFWKFMRNKNLINEEISIVHLSNYLNSLSEIEKPRFGTLSALISWWTDLELYGFSKECADFLGERRISGNIKGESVKTRDPINGPFSEQEYIDIYKSVDAAWAEGRIEFWVFILTRLLFACGARSSQYASLKVCDFSIKDGTFTLLIPQVKKRSFNSRDELRAYSLSPQTGELMLEYIETLFSIGLTRDDALFPEALIKDSNCPDGKKDGNLFNGHLDKDILVKKYNQVMRKISPPSERLNYAPTPITPRRFRYTFGTRLVEEGASQFILADRLGHTDTQNVAYYYEVSPIVVDKIDKAMDEYLLPISAAFRGRLIQGELDSTHKGALGSRIIDFKTSTKPLASCAGGDCSFNKPVACYTCVNFEPWIDGPHEEILQRLLNEKEERNGDSRISKINDDAIRAVKVVIDFCKIARNNADGV